MAAGTRNVTGKSVAASSTGAVFKVTKTLDFADIVAVKGAAIEANEIAQLISIPKNTLVLGVSMKVIKAAAGTTLTAQVGDGDNALGYIGTTDLKSAAGTVVGAANTLTEGTPNVAAPAFFAGKLYAADDTIDVKVIGYDTVTTLPVIQVTAVCAYME